MRSRIDKLIAVSIAGRRGREVRSERQSVLASRGVEQAGGQRKCAESRAGAATRVDTCAICVHRSCAVNKVLVIGPGGAGKSTFANALGERTGLPVIHLDALYWRPGWVAT